MIDIINIIIERKEWFLGLMGQHLMIAGIAIVLAGLIGLFTGILIYEKKKLAGVVLSITNVLYTIPDIAMFGFLIPLTGIGNKTAVIALTIYSLLPMIRNTYTGLAQVDPDIIEAASGMGSTKLQMLIKIRLPLAFPVILTGIRSMVVMAVSIAGIASFIGAGGLGQAIYRGIATNNQTLMLAGSMIIALIAILLDTLFSFCEQSFEKRKSTRKRNFAIAFLVIIFGSVVIGSLVPVEKKEIVVAYDNTAEEAIVANMLIMLIEKNTDITVEEMGDLAGGETVMFPAAVEGEIDIYPEYTGTAWLAVLKHTDIPDQETMNEQLQLEFNDKYDLRWLGMYGFNNSYGIAVKQEIADKYNLKTFSDLAKISGEIRFGAEPGFFEREDGYNRLCEVYDMNFASHSDINFALKYDAIESNKVDAIIIFTTDGRLAGSRLTVLEDDKNLFPKYLCGNVIRIETLQKYPQLEAVLKLTNNLISDEEMSWLNKQVEVEGREPYEVAKEFLRSKGFLE